MCLRCASSRGTAESKKNKSVSGPIEFASTVEASIAVEETTSAGSIENIEKVTGNTIDDSLANCQTTAPSAQHSLTWTPPIGTPYFGNSSVPSASLSSQPGDEAMESDCGDIFANTASPQDPLLAENFEQFLADLPSSLNFELNMDLDLETTESGSLVAMVDQPCRHLRFPRQMSLDSSQGAVRPMSAPTDLGAWLAVSTHSIAGSSPDAHASSEAMSSIFSIQNPRSPTPSCSCFARALALLHRMTPAKYSSDRSNWVPAPRFETILSQNGAALTTVQHILQCSCSKGVCTLFALVLIVFKTLGWYAAAASAVPAGDPRGVTTSPTSQKRPQWTVQLSADSLEGFDLVGEDLYHMTRQLVLSKLHNVQRTVKLLSQRLLNVTEHQSVSKSSDDRIATAADELLLGDDTLDHATAQRLVHDLNASMRSRQHELCAALMERLRNP